MHLGEHRGAAGRRAQREVEDVAGPDAVEVAPADDVAGVVDAESELEVPAQRRVDELVQVDEAVLIAEEPGRLLGVSGVEETVSR